MKKLIIFLVLLTNFTSGQTGLINKDTSYTVNSTYNKLVKQFPFIKPVKPILPDSINAIRNITYIKYDERKLSLDIFYKQTDIKNKAVILVHGGGWRSGDKSLTFPLALQLAKRGYVCVSVEYRLSPEALFPAAIVDVRNSIKWLKKNAEYYCVDTNKIAILGCSAGGQIASLVGFSEDQYDFEDFSTSSGYSSKVSAIINVDGLLDFLGKGSQEFDESPDDKNPRSAHKWLGASHIEEPELWIKASPINYINKNSIPILFINSSRPRFHAGRDEAILKLEKFDILYEVQTFQNSPHSFWLYDPWFNETLVYITDFLDIVFNK